MGEPPPKLRKNDNDKLSVSVDSGECANPDNGQRSSSLDPLLIDLILENVFQFCSLKTLNNCRLVNTHWHRVSMSTWLKNCPQVVICPISKKFEKDEKTFFMHDFLDTVHKGTHAPYEFTGVRQYKNFKLSYTRFSSDFTYILNFWNKCGKWITNLKLLNVRFSPDLKSFKDIMFCKYTPSLVKLDVVFDYEFDEKEGGGEKDCEKDEGYKHNKNLKSLIICFDDEKRAGRKLPICWKELLLNYPNLLRLSLGGVHKEWEMELDRMFKAIVDIRKEDKQKLNLKSLDILEIFEDFGIEKLPPSVFRFFKESQLSIECLKIDLGKETSVLEMEKVLSFFAKSLKCLTIYKHRPEKNFQLPKLDSLEGLTLVGYPFADLTFLKRFPNLKHLTLERDSDFPDPEKNILENTSKEDMAEVKLEKLTGFSCDYEHFWKEKDLKKVITWMPNLKWLEMELTNETFRVVCKYMKNLEEIHVLRDNVNDEGITGWRGYPVTEEEEKIRALLPVSAITDLKNLKVFTMEHSFGGQELATLLTEKSVFLGFLKLPKLERLDITVKEMSSEAMKALKEKLENVRVTLEQELESDSDDIHSSEEDLESGSEDGGAHEEEGQNNPREGLEVLVEGNIAESDDEDGDFEESDISSDAYSNSDSSDSGSSSSGSEDGDVCWKEEMMKEQR